jgi:hypothetical protein
MQLQRLLSASVALLLLPLLLQQIRGSHFAPVAMLQAKTLCHHKQQEQTCPHQQRQQHSC